MKWVKGPNGCRLWTASHGHMGHGRFRIGMRQVQAHRYAYERERGPIPDGLHLDHVVCNNPPCVNPWHVEPRTLVENVMRGQSPHAQNARKTHCLRGHPLSGDNVYRWKTGRFCKACLNEYKREQRRHLRELRPPVTHCKRGHEFTPENTYRTPRGTRECRTCNKCRRQHG